MQIDYLLKPLRHESSGEVFAKVSHGDGAHLSLKDNSVDAVSTDPPYFDAIAYADLSDYFYIWLKRSIGDALPEAFVTPQTPKSEEAVAHKHRHHGNRQKGKEHFQNKLTECFAETKRVCKPDGVIAVMFAHQDTEAWSALINALFEAGLNVTATYPIDTELTTALKGSVSALASSITVICRPREVGSATSFRDVRRQIDDVVAKSVHRFFEYGLRGADLIVACYGPAVGVFGRYERVERADGTVVGVPELLQLVRESALKAIAGEFEGDNLSRLYFVWANLYGVGEQAWDDARLVVQIGGEAESAMDVARNRGLFVVDGSTVRLALLADRSDRRNLGDDPSAPLIDQLHHMMMHWKREERSEIVSFLWQRGLLDDTRFWKLAQALFEVLPHETEDWKLVSALLGERETFKTEAKKSAGQERLL
jgi:adenine-specific DNA methylase